MIDTQKPEPGRTESPSLASPTWWIVLKRELTELWVGGRAPTLLILFSILMSITAFLLATNSELSLIPPKEMIFLILEASITFGLFISLIIAADSISGERERATLEAILLTPASRTQIVVGKFLAAVSPWPVAYLISVPYVTVLSQGEETLGQALLTSALLGTVLASAFAGFGMLVSIWSNSNRTSLFVSLIVYILLVLPTQLPGEAQSGAVGDFVQAADPMEATHHYLEKTLVNNRTLEEMWNLLVSPVLFAVIACGLLFWYASPGLRLEAGRASMLRPRAARVANLLVIAGLAVSLIAGTTTTMARQAVAAPGPQLSEASQVAQEGQQGGGGEEEKSAQVEPPTGSAPPLQIDIDTGYKVVKTGDKIVFNTLVTNNSEEESPLLVVSMNMVNLDAEGDPVDPEDWSPERSQTIEALAPGESSNLTWVINAIIEGDYMVYLVVIPEPDSQESTSQPVASSGLHLTVTPFTRTNPGGVLPLVIGMPIGLTVVSAVLRRLRRREIDMGGS